MRRFAAGAVAAVSLISMSSSYPEASHPEANQETTQETAQAQPPVISDSERNLVTQEFDKVKQYWLRKNIGGIAATELVILSGDDTFTCRRSPKHTGLVNANADSQYCPEDDTVVITAQTVTAYNEPEDREAYTRYVVAHEVGHAIQDAEGRLGRYMDDPNVRPPLELEATGLAGDYMADNYDGLVVGHIATMLSITPTDIRHGSPPEQAAAFISRGGPRE